MPVFSKRTGFQGLGNKYKAVRVTSHAGRSFGSKLESALYDILLSRELSGEISDIRQQVRVELTKARIVLIPDFSAVSKATGQTVYFEAKGYETPEYRIKRRLWKHYGPGPLEVFKGSYKRVKYVETITPSIDD